MNRDDIIRMARHSGLVGLEQGGILENFQRFAALVAAAEREACAMAVWRVSGIGLDDQRKAIAAIRARGAAT